MKIEQLIVQHLYISKQVTLQGIGTFKLDPSVTLPAANDKDKDFSLPENAFQFEYNLKAVEDDALIKYIVQHTSKILPLASADLDSYVILAKQFLNIGKPLVIEGVGTIQKNQAGIYEFNPGHFVTPKINDIPRQIKEKREEAISFETEPSVNNSRRNLMIFVTFLVIAATGFGIWYMVTYNDIESVGSTSIISTKDTTPSTSTNIPVKADTLQNIPAPVANTDGSSFKIVLKKYTSERAAQKAFAKLTTYGHKLVVIKVDSTNYQVAMPFTTPVSDTARARDSLKRFFGGSPFVKL